MLSCLPNAHLLQQRLYLALGGGRCLASQRAAHAALVAVRIQASTV